MSKQFYFEQLSLALVQFQCQKQFYFKHLSLASVRSSHVKTVLIQVIQFALST